MSSSLVHNGIYVQKKNTEEATCKKKTIKNTVAADARGRGVLSENNLFFFKKKGGTE